MHPVRYKTTVSNLPDGTIIVVIEPIITASPGRGSKPSFLSGRGRARSLLKGRSSVFTGDRLPRS
jgi:hypothetical protein